MRAITLSLSRHFASPNPIEELETINHLREEGGLTGDMPTANCTNSVIPYSCARHPMIEVIDKSPEEALSLG